MSFKLPDDVLQILADNRMAYGIDDHPAKVVKAGEEEEPSRVTVWVEDSMTKARVATHTMEGTGPGTEAQCAIAAIRKAAGSPKPLTPAQTAAALSEATDEIEKLKEQLAGGTAKPKEPGEHPITPKAQRLIDDMKERKITIPGGDKNSNRWIERSEILLAAHEKAMLEEEEEAAALATIQSAMPQS
jgi:hypothetical protein